MPKVSRKESSKPTTSASTSEKAEKKTKRRSKPGSRSKKEIAFWTHQDSKLPIRFQRIARIAREQLEEVIAEHYADDMGESVPKFRKGFMLRLHDFTVRQVIDEISGARECRDHAGRSTLMKKDWQVYQKLLAHMH